MTGKIVVIGGSGLAGRALTALLARRAAPVAVPGRQALDLTDLARLPARLAALDPAVVYNAAGFTDVARAELPAHRADVERLNHEAPAVLARTCRELGCPFVHLSTDYVFDGRATVAYREEDRPAPLQVYGSSKLAGELDVQREDPAALIVRTSTLYGPTERARLHYVDAILRQARAGTPLAVVRLPIASPTHAPDLAEGLVALTEAAATGLVHLVNGGAASRLELAREAVRLAGLPVEVRERPQPPGELARPAFSALSTERYSRLTGRVPRPWQDALRAYLAGAA